MLVCEVSKKAYLRAQDMTSITIHSSLCKIDSKVWVTRCSNVGYLGHPAKNCKVQPGNFKKQDPTVSEKNYITFEKELIATVYTFKKVEYMLADREIYIQTDHQALIHHFETDMISARVARWCSYLDLFNIQVIDHVPGAENIAPDALSR